jgi:hypothetical protein
MKTMFSSIAVLMLSLIARPQAFSAVVGRTDADVPAPDVQYSVPPQDNAVLTESLELSLNFPVVRTTFLKTTRPKWRTSRAKCPMN